MVSMSVWLQGAAKCYFILSTAHDVFIVGFSRRTCFLMHG